MPASRWISPSTSIVMGWDSTNMLLMLSLQRYSPASTLCTWLMLLYSSWGYLSIIWLPFTCSHNTCHTPDSGEESSNPVCDGLELIDHYLHVCSQILASLHPHDGGLQSDIGYVDGAVELSLMTLWQLYGANSWLEMQPFELIRAQIHLWSMAQDHKRLRGPGGSA